MSAFDAAADLAAALDRIKLVAEDASQHSVRGRSSMPVTLDDVALLVSLALVGARQLEREAAPPQPIIDTPEGLRPRMPLGHAAWLKGRRSC